MPATDTRKAAPFLMRKLISTQASRVRAAGMVFLLSMLSVWLGGCTRSSPQVDGPDGASTSTSSDLPEITDEVIRTRINDAYIPEVPEESGSAEHISWRFDEDEPKEIAVVEKVVNGGRGTIVLDIKTRSAPGMRNPRSLAGRIRTQWELKTGWALRRWEIVETENISMKYKNLPKPQNTNQNTNQ